MIPAIEAQRVATGEADGPVLVLGNSLGTDHTMWKSAVTELEALRPGVRVLAWDLPGHGASPAATGPFSIAELADAVLAAVDAEFGETTPFVYAGDSVSGEVGFELASRNLERLRAAVPVCSAPRIGTPDTWADRAELVRGQGLAPLVESTRERWFGPGFADAHPELAEPMLETLRGADPESYALICEALAHFDAWAALPDTLTRVHVVLGDADQAVPVDQARTVADKAGNAEVTVIPGVGHQAPVEAPAEIAATLSTELG